MATGIKNLGIGGTVGEGILGGKKLAASSVIIALVLVATTAGGMFLYGDWDGDNLGTYKELFETSTSPFDKDSDRDGVGDGKEIRLGTDSKDSDTDNDSLSDNVEIRY